MNKYEYKIFTHQIFSNDSAITEYLNELGQEGWELLEMTSENNHYRCVMKRAIDKNLNENDL